MIVRVLAVSVCVLPFWPGDFVVNHRSWWRVLQPTSLREESCIDPLLHHHNGNLGSET